MEWLTSVLPKRDKPSKILYNLTDEEAANIFAFIGGYVDAAGYMKIAGLFTSSITGNLVATTASIYHSDGVVCRVLVSVLFVLGGVMSVQLFIYLIQAWEWKQRTAATLVFIIEGVALCLALILGTIWNDQFTGNDILLNPLCIIVACCMSFSMGIQAASVKELFPNAPSTTVITALLTTFATQVTQTTSYALASCNIQDLHPRSKEKTSEYTELMHKKRAEYNTKFVSTTRQLIAFLGGALVGAAVMYNISFYSLFVPIAIVWLIALDISLANRPTQDKIAHSPLPISNEQAIKQEDSKEISMQEVTPRPAVGLGDLI